MIGVIRNKFGPVIIGSVVAVIAAVFIFYGVFTPGAGSGAPSVAGEVNGETISFTEFSRALNQRLEFFKGLMGGKVTQEQLAQFHIPEAVFQDLAQRKVLGQIARKEGFYPSHEQIREQIVKMDVFKKDGRFDKVQYKNVLAANQYSPTRFEELIGQDIMEQNFRDFITRLAFVSDDEVQAELKSSKTKWKVKYVYLDHEQVRKTLPKDLKPEQASAQLNTKTESLSKEILPLLAKGSDSALNGILKGFKTTDNKGKEVALTAKTSEWINSENPILPGVGSIRSIESELLGMKKGEQPKKFTLMGGTLFAMITDQQTFDPSKVTEKEKTDILGRLQQQKQSEIMGSFLTAYMKKASVTRNDKVVTGGQGTNIPVTMDQ